MGYLTTAEYRALAGKKSVVDSSSDTVLQLHIDAASEHIDTWCGRGRDSFKPSTTASSRCFVGEGLSELRVDGFYIPAGESVTVADSSGTAITADAFPLNDLQHLWLRYSNRIARTIWREDGIYTVTAWWGIAETPNDVKVCTKQLTDLSRLAGRLAFSKLGEGEFKVTEGPTPQARELLRQYLADWRVGYAGIV